MTGQDDEPSHFMYEETDLFVTMPHLCGCYSKREEVLNPSSVYFYVASLNFPGVFLILPVL